MEPPGTSRVAFSTVQSWRYMDLIDITVRAKSRKRGRRGASLYVTGFELPRADPPEGRAPGARRRLRLLAATLRARRKLLARIRRTEAMSVQILVGSAL